MRTRLLIALCALAAIAVLGFALPLSASVARGRTQELVLGRSGDAEWFAMLAAAALETGDHRALAAEVGRYRELYHEGVVIVDARGAVVTGVGVDVRDPATAAALAAARRNEIHHPPDRLTPWSSDAVFIARPVGSGVQINGAVLIEASARQAKTDIGRMWLAVGLAAGIAMALFAGLAVMLSRWVLRPLTAMSHAVAGLTASLPRARGETPDISLTRSHGGPPEMRELTESFDAMASAVTNSVHAQRRLVADTAHTMRNPLTALAIRLESLEPSIPDTAESAFRKAGREVERLTAMLDGLLYLAAAETPSGLDAPPPDTCDAVQVVANRVDAWRPAFDRKNVGLATGRGATHAPTAASDDVVDQILDVLLSNSCLYAGPTTTTTVTVAAESEWVSIVVSDNGVGVPADEIDRLTTRFFRGSSANAAGSGLGLPIVAALTRGHNGTMTVAAVVPHGLAVTVRLPRAARP